MKFFSLLYQVYARMRVAIAHASINYLLQKTLSRARDFFEIWFAFVAEDRRPDINV